MEELKPCYLCNKEIEETQSRVIHTECNYVHRKCEEQYKNGSLKGHTRPTPDLTKGIVWEGECGCCKGHGRHAEGNSGSYPCNYMNCGSNAHREYNTSDDVPKELLQTKCNGTGTIKRQATLEECQAVGTESIKWFTGKLNLLEQDLEQYKQESELYVGHISFLEWIISEIKHALTISNGTLRIKESI